MSTPSSFLPAPGADAARDRAVSASTQAWAYPLLMRLHFYIGILVGPFLLFAALSGLLYALTPQLENLVYRHELYTSSTGAALPLAEQIKAASQLVGDGGRLAAVRPAPEPGTTTRIMFAVTGMGPSEHRAVFVDPANVQIRGDLGVYGTSGALPIRAWIDLLHRSLHLGDVGRLYSELAASWLWVLALGGLVLWVLRARLQRRASPVSQGIAGHRVRRWHRKLGLWLLLGLLFFSATGLTWSQWAGANISVLRAYYGWGTPSVSTSLEAMPQAAATGHEHHHQAPAPVALAAGDAALFDAVLGAARANGIQAGKVEIRPPAKPDRAWTVTEIDRSWPTRVDAVAVDPRTLAIVDRTRFEDFPIAAKLTRWGIDAHMGALFGLPNQIVLVLLAGGLATMVVWGYLMWWRRRPTRQGAAVSPATLIATLRKTPRPGLLAILAGTALLAWFLPVMGASLLGFLGVDLIRYLRARKPACH